MDVLHPDPLHRVELAMEDLRAGRAIILVDDEDRENEGDIVVAAEKVTPEHINFMAVHARGLICLTLTNDQVQKLALPMMATNNQSQFQTAFTVSIEAREGVTTGISAADRAKTVHDAIAVDANPRSVVTPGHMFPLRARDGGVLERVGQTEGSVDLARLAGLNPSAVICEIIKDDGTMARMPDLKAFGAEHGIRICTVADIIKYRMQRERVVRREAEGTIDLPGVGTFRTQLYRSLRTDGLHMAYTLGEADPESSLVRVQAAPPPWAFLNPEVSRTAQTATKALRAIAAEGRGALVCMHASMGTLEQLQHSFERDFGEAGRAPVQPSAEALRDLGTGCQILVDLGFENLRILTSSTRPIVGVEAYGLQIIEKVPL